MDSLGSFEVGVKVCTKDCIVWSDVQTINP